jgi:hypothetical protein
MNVVKCFPYQHPSSVLFTTQVLLRFRSDKELPTKISQYFHMAINFVILASSALELFVPEWSLLDMQTLRC